MNYNHNMELHDKQSTKDIVIVPFYLKVVNFFMLHTVYFKILFV